MNLINFIKSIEPDKKKAPFAHTAYDAFFTFLFTPNSTTSGKGVHIRDGMDLKRLMVTVVVALQVLYLFGTYNIGHQHFVALGQHTGLLEAVHLKIAHGLIKILPIFIVTHVVGLAIEFWYAAKKGHAVEEGFLVSGALIPLIMPPDLPLWILGVSVAFAVIIGKEAFGGTGMNVLNIALLARVFIFFAYPTDISGDDVWISGIEKVDGAYVGQMYGIVHGMLDGLFGSIGWSTFGEGGMAVVDGYTGATPLSLAAKGGWQAVTEVYSQNQIFWGTIPGSIGESSAPLIIVGAIVLMVMGIASWRIIISGVVGAIVMSLLLNAWGATPFMEVSWQNQLIMGSFLFAITFMATDPVSAASTNTGKLIYGFLIGAVGMIIRVMNPAYPEGWMLAILFMNVFAPLIDHYVIEGNISRRVKRAKAVAAGN
ncbi:MAG: NADH:ubiquinone reductase (Na(+)-transporting) subunit B [Bacteroidota bacterium]